MSWWSRATESERLAQIDGCIEVGMTVKQCAMNLGVAKLQTVWMYAASRGRRFGWDDYRSKVKGEKIAVSHRRLGGLKTAKQAYLSGEPVDFWSVE